MGSDTWNEFNTFSKLIFPYLRKLRYPARESEYFDEQTWVRKRGQRNGPYDGAFKDEFGVLLLVEAKKEGLPLGNKEIEQAFDYALGGTFHPLPPPYILVSNGHDHLWFRRFKIRDERFEYRQCGEPVPWPKALEDRAGGVLSEELPLNKLIKLLERVLIEIFNDLKTHYFPRGFSLDKSTLGRRQPGFERILNTRKCFVDRMLGAAKEKEANEAVLSSIALSLTLKVLFVKIQTDLRSQPFPINVRKYISEQSADFPGILKAEPYDILQFSDECEEAICKAMGPIRISQALVFNKDHNPIGDIWDGLIESEEHDIQVKSLGNVYTPPALVRSMVDAAERALGSWSERQVLEPACGSGHFVREVYTRMFKTYVAGSGSGRNVIAAHRAVLAHLKASDIDPFAVQTTQLGMFLELYRNPTVWQQIATRGRFDFSKVVMPADFLADMFNPLRGFTPDLIIGNPPYGITVTDDVEKVYGLGNNDSYGCFIARALDALKSEGHLLFVVSSTFLTVRTHRLLRERIFTSSDLRSVLLLHRNAFPGRDVFCCLIHLQRRNEKKRNNERTEYRFCDAWPIHPDKPEYIEALTAWAKGCRTTIAPELFGDYMIPEELVTLRLMPPAPRSVDETIESGARWVGLDLADVRETVHPIFGGLPSLYLFCADRPYRDRVRAADVGFAGLGRLRGIEVRRSARTVPIVKLWQIAGVRQGLATADDERFLRKTPGVVPNARRRNIRDVDPRCAVTPERLARLTPEERANGIPVTDPQRDRYFVPFDKGGEQDTAAGELRAFWSPVDYWIDWSEGSVRELRRRSKLPAGTPRKAVIRNADYYFQRGIRFSPAGLYAPMFETSFGGVFGHKGSLIIPFDDGLTLYLLTLLCSPLTRYLTKNFLQHTVMTEIDIIRQIPIVVPNVEERRGIEAVAKRIIRAKERGKNANDLMEIAWKLIYRLYDIPAEDRREVETWFKRRYPHFGRALREPATSPVSEEAQPTD